MNDPRPGLLLLASGVAVAAAAMASLSAFANDSYLLRPSLAVLGWGGLGLGIIILRGRVADGLTRAPTVLAIVGLVVCVWVTAPVLRAVADRFVISKMSHEDEVAGWLLALGVGTMALLLAAILISTTARALRGG